MDAAEKHHNRYKAVLGKIAGACIRLSALEAWAREKDWPISFVQLFRWEGEGVGPPPDRYFIDVQLVDMKVAERFAQVSDDRAIAEYAWRWHGVRKEDRGAAYIAMMAQVFHRLLCAVFDGELTMYDPARFPIDLSEERLRYEAAPESFATPESRGIEPHATRPFQRQRAQEQVILAALRENGFDPRALPRGRNGIAGVRAAMRKALLQQKTIFQSRRTFDDAWQRLRDDGEIVDAT